jgi:hypothetical protein
MSIRVSDLHEAYASASGEDRITMANLGAICWESFKDGLYELWNSELSSAEADKASKYREQGKVEGRQLMLESLKERLAEVESLQGELSIARAAIDKLKTSIDIEAAKQAEIIVENKKKDIEMKFKDEISILKEQLAKINGREESFNMLKESNKKLEEELKQLKGVPGGVYNKSSQAIGKIGEGQVMDILTYGVCPRFQYSSVKNVTSEGHAADFHLFVHGPKRELIKILIDAKKYNYPIEKKEIIKLHADVDADEDAKAGMMISLTSVIQNTRMFSIKYTDRGRPVVYINFTDVEVDMHIEVVCWAVHILQSISLKGDIDDRLRMIEEIDLFLESLDKSVREIDSVIRQQMKTLSAMRDMKAGLIRKIQGFRESRGEDNDGSVVDDSDNLEEDSCEVLLKTTGKKCGRKVVAGSMKCGMHSERGAKKTGGLKGEVIHMGT